MARGQPSSVRRACPGLHTTTAGSPAAPLWPGRAGGRSLRLRRRVRLRTSPGVTAPVGGGGRASHCPARGQGGHKTKAGPGRTAPGGRCICFGVRAEAQPTGRASCSAHRSENRPKALDYTGKRRAHRHSAPRHTTEQTRDRNHSRARGGRHAGGGGAPWRTVCKRGASECRGTSLRPALLPQWSPGANPPAGPPGAAVDSSARHRETVGKPNSCHWGGTKPGQPDSGPYGRTTCSGADTPEKRHRLHRRGARCAACPGHYGPRARARRLTHTPRAPSGSLRCPPCRPRSRRVCPPGRPSPLTGQLAQSEDAGGSACLWSLWHRSPVSYNSSAR